MPRTVFWELPHKARFASVGEGDRDRRRSSGTVFGRTWEHWGELFAPRIIWKRAKVSKKCPSKLSREGRQNYISH